MDEHSVNLLRSPFIDQVNNLCMIINQKKNTNELLECSLKRIMEFLNARRGSIFILQQNTKELVLQISNGIIPLGSPKIIKRLGEGVVGKVAQMRKAILVEDITRDSRFQNFKSRQSYQTSSFICAPLMINDRLLGVINIADKKFGEPFDMAELQFLDFLSTQIAFSYQRIQLYQESRVQLKTLKEKLDLENEELNHLKKQMITQEKFASLGKLAGGIAHEFNNPLDGVTRYTNLSLAHLKDDEVVRGYLLEIKYGLNRMANIIKSLLACSRNYHSALQRINLNSSIDKVIESLQSEMLLKNITIKKDFLEKIPLIPDKGIELIISNLVKNAIDAINKNGEISITTKNNYEYVVLQVSDSGCGFDPKLTEKIFEPFYTTKNIGKGCGLGLTIVSEIVKSYNGEIRVQSAIHQGSIFTVFIPTEIQNHDSQS